MAALRLVVANAGTPTAADLALQTILEDGGANTVALISDEDAEDLTGGIKAAILAASVDAVTLGNKYRNPSGIGVVSLRTDITDVDQQNWHGNQGSTGSDQGVDITVAGEAHALANGLTNAGNTHDIYAANQNQQMTTSVALGDGVTVAFRGASGTQRVLIGWDIGDQLEAGIACAGRHVIAGFASIPASLNATGQALLLNAVEWAGQFGAYDPNTVFGPEDDFSTDEVSTNFPDSYTDAAMTMEIVNSRARSTYAVSASGSRFSGLVTASDDFTGKTAHVQLARLHAANSSCHSWFTLGPDTLNLVYFYFIGHNLTVQQRVAGVDTQLADLGTVTVASHRFLRLREDSGTTYWETSTDGETWTERHSALNPISYAGAIAEIGGGTVASVAAPGVFEWAGFNTVEYGLTQAIDPLLVGRDLGESLGLEFDLDPLLIGHIMQDIDLGGSAIFHALTPIRVGRQLRGPGISYELAPLPVGRFMKSFIQPGSGATRPPGGRWLWSWH